MIACYSIFNEAEFLEESILSIKDFVDKIVVVDGAYENFPHDSFWSTDGSIEIAKKYGADVVIPTCAWSSQIHKRNQYLKFGQPGDVMITIDGHEIWTGVLEPQNENCRIEMYIKDSLQEFFRMFVWEPGIEYRNYHYDLWVGSRRLNDTYSKYTKGVFIHKDVSDKQRLKDKETYYSLPVSDRQ